MIPEELVQQFRGVALERLERIEQSWASVIAKLDEEYATVAHRELHTLKGESRMLGFSDVNLVCHKLEDLLEVAQARGYAIDEDFDLAVNMAIRFMVMLVRKKIGAQLVGIDLPGFIKQIDGILAETRPAAPTTARASTGSMPIKINQPRVSASMRARLSPIAVDAFIEYAVARGMRRDRLRTSWHALRDMLGIQRAVLGPAQLHKHVAGAQTLAEELGKQIDIKFQLPAIDATAEILAAIDTAVLHIIRNAIDHGIETPAERERAGKLARGTIQVRAVTSDTPELFQLTLEDDGRGVDLEEVRARAIARGALRADDDDLEDRWLDLICLPGFTTRTTASDVSGRGVGLDIVRANITDVGGSLSATTEAGRGTRWHLKVPVPRVTVHGHQVRVPGVPFPIVVDSSWSIVEQPGAATRVFDLAHRLGLVDEPTAKPPCYFRRDDLAIGLVVDRAPAMVEAQRLVAAPLPAIGEIAISDAVECLLLHPERLLSR